ncbi:MAG: ABC transporter permease [Patescibacteria group bacterium]|nr:ABC transporter permease [Patescibacteria group bacterium]MDE2015708.1 ABC transporter permease [Patescibacteria group bacterium]MDE2226766.1 ABC transporter permease [Patescibacteria group bacterium]
MKTIYILWLRQIKRYLRSRSRIVGSLGQPLLFLLALGYGLGSTFKAAGEGNYFTFLAPGVIGMSIIFTAIFSGIELIWDRQFGFLKETMVAPVSRLNIMVGRTLGGATVATMQGLIVFFITLFFGFRPENWALLPVLIIFMLLVALLFTALGTAIASVLEDMQGFQLIMNFLVMPLFFLSGALFPIENLPSVLTVLVGIDPLSYGIDSFRSILSGTASFGLGLDLSVLVIVTLFCLGLGSYLFSRIEV